MQVEWRNTSYIGITNFISNLYIVQYLRFNCSVNYLLLFYVNEIESDREVIDVVDLHCIYKLVS